MQVMEHGKRTLFNEKQHQMLSIVFGIMPLVGTKETIVFVFTILYSIGGEIDKFKVSRAQYRPHRD